FALTDNAPFTIYVNGVDDTGNPPWMGDNPKDTINGINNLNFTIGAESDGDNPFHGSIDEVRISKTSFSPNWIATEHENQLDPQSFYNVGLEQFGDFVGPSVNDFGVEQSGTGLVTYWANITDVKGSVSSGKIEINSSIFDLSFNGSFWIYQQFPNFNDFFTFKIMNATDSQGNFLLVQSIEKNITINIDSQKPQVLDWIFDSVLGDFGTFRANVSDPWGEIDIVKVEVTYCETCGALPDPAIMQKSGNEYINNTIFMTRGEIWFRIIANDTLGNIVKLTMLPKYGI
ncbi:MAG: LamG-like jellyroll fold domain-containing protein, partial [Candidatus Kariarchaeaceae archaeon]